jgi:cytoskeletal protein RodZ
LGEKLRSARESKGYNFDFVGRETNIATRYLEAFEEENFSVFPGESYLIGFLRNYGEYLDLNVQELLSIYKAMKLQEQDIPVEQLLKSPSKLPRILITAAIVLVILGATGGAAYFFTRVSWKPAVPEAAVRPAVSYTLEGNFLERRFYQGDTVLIPLDGSQYKAELSHLGEAVTISLPDDQVILDLGQETSVDLDNNGTEDLRIGAVDFVRNDESMGALLRFETINNFRNFEEIVSAEPADGEIPAAPVPDQQTAGVAVPAIFMSSNAYPFTLHASFQGFCMFRWEILREQNRQERNEQYFVRNDERNIQAQNGIRIWVSNAVAVKLEVIGGGRTVPLEIGGAGEVVVADIHWVRDEDGRYRLILVRLD